MPGKSGAGQLQSGPSRASQGRPRRVQRSVPAGWRVEKVVEASVPVDLRCAACSQSVQAFHVQCTAGAAISACLKWSVGAECGEGGEQHGGHGSEPARTHRFNRCLRELVERHLHAHSQAEQFALAGDDSAEEHELEDIYSFNGVERLVAKHEQAISACSTSGGGGCAAPDPIPSVLFGWHTSV